MAIDANKLANEIFTAAKGVASQRWDKGVSFAVQGSRELAEFSAAAAIAIASGGLDQPGIENMARRVGDQAHEFALTLANLIVAAIAAVFNAVINIVWSTLMGALQGTGFSNLLPPKPQF